MRRYSHFWTLTEAIPDRLCWPRILRDARAVLTAFEHLVKANGHTRAERYVAQSIDFDSLDPTEDTRFCIKLGAKPFQYCTTNRTEYDLPVSAVLLVVKRHAPQWLTITSDGRWRDFQPARDVLRDLLSYEDADFAEAKKDFDSIIAHADDPEDYDAFLRDAVFDPTGDDSEPDAARGAR